jgi:hypothetical protein
MQHPDSHTARLSEVLMKVTEYKVGEVKCIDDGKTKGVIIGCEGRNLVSLVFDASIPHKQTNR